MLTEITYRKSQAISRYLKDIREKPFSETDRKYLADNVEGLSAMVMYQVRGFQSFLNLMQDEVRLFKSDVDLAREIQRVVHFMAPIAHLQEVQIDIQGIDRLPRRIRVDSMMIGQLLYIMLDNAIKYSARQSHSPILVDASQSKRSKAVVRFMNKGVRVRP